MRPAPDYSGPVWITGGAHKGRLAFLEGYELENGAEVGEVYLEGEVPGRGAAVRVPVAQLEVPPLDQISALEDRLWIAATLKR